MSRRGHESLAAALVEQQDCNRTAIEGSELRDKRGLLVSHFALKVAAAA